MMIVIDSHDDYCDELDHGTGNDDSDVIDDEEDDGWHDETDNKLHQDVTIPWLLVLSIIG